MCINKTNEKESKTQCQHLGHFFHKNINTVKLITLCFFFLTQLETKLCYTMSTVCCYRRKQSNTRGFFNTKPEFWVIGRPVWNRSGSLQGLLRFSLRGIAIHLSSALSACYYLKWMPDALEHSRSN